MPNTSVINPDLEFIGEVKRFGGDTLKKCYQCATCSVICNLSPEERPFPRKEMILAQWGQADRLAKDPDIWLCHQCGDCTARCPRGARPGDVLAAVRAFIYKKYSFPSFMGKALASPKALPILLLLPVMILLGGIFLFAPQSAGGGFAFFEAAEVDFDLFLRHSSIDALFVFGNILIFSFAAVGFYRFWKAIQIDGQPAGMSVGRAFFITVQEIITHKNFFKCETNRPRSWAHLLVLGGFGGAMVTTGSVFLFIFIPHYLGLLGLESLAPFFELPLDLPNPIKFLGMFSGLALLAGGSILIVRRWKNRDNVGANGYADYLFLYMLFLVGLTGMLAWLIRLTGIAMLAYSIYFAHLVTVFFLLWYMPYSKFAHMFYRTMALVYCRSIGRVARA
jgi:quinone-modifying oxidoreductase subunit QmoC